MNVIIIGCGRVGTTLAEKLNDDGNNVTVIDTRSEKVEKVINRFDVLGIVGNGATYSVQKEAGIDTADLLIAVTDSDELNLLCCVIAGKQGKCQTVARVKSPEYSEDSSYLKGELDLALVINPEYESAEEIARVLRFPSAIKIEPFAKGEVELVKFKLPKESPAVGLSVKELMIKYKLDVLVCTIERGDDAFIANGDFVFQEKDVVSIVASPKNAVSFFKKMHFKGNSVKNVIVAGGGVITHYLCDILAPSGINLKVIEKDKNLCEEIAEKWENVTVINGDTSDNELLMEENLATTDAFVTLADFDEENIILSMFAKGVGSAKLVTKINRIDYASVVNQLDLDTVICPRSITADTILRFVRAMNNTRGGNVETLYNIIPGKVEASEFSVTENSPITGVPLYQLKTKGNVLIASIFRDGKVIIPRGQDTIEVGDSVVVVSSFPLLNLVDILK